VGGRVPSQQSRNILSLVGQQSLASSRAAQAGYAEHNASGVGATVGPSEAITVGSAEAGLVVGELDGKSVVTKVGCSDAALAVGEPDGAAECDGLIPVPKSRLP